MARTWARPAAGPAPAGERPTAGAAHRATTIPASAARVPHLVAPKVQRSAGLRGAGFKVPPRLPGAARWIRPAARAVPTAALAPPVRITAVVGPTGPTAG